MPRTRRCRQARVKQVAGVRRADAAQRALAIERDAVKIQLGHPESRFDRLSQRLGTVAPSTRRVVVAAPGGKLGHRQSRGEYVSLDFYQGYGSRRNAAIGMKHRVDAVFPPLVGKSGRQSALVIEEAVAIRIP